MQAVLLTAGALVILLVCRLGRRRGHLVERRQQLLSVRLQTLGLRKLLPVVYERYGISLLRLRQAARHGLILHFDSAAAFQGLALDQTERPALLFLRARDVKQVAFFQRRFLVEGVEKRALNAQNLVGLVRFVLPRELLLAYVTIAFAVSVSVDQDALAARRGAGVLRPWRYDQTVTSNAFVTSAPIEG